MLIYKRLNRLIMKRFLLSVVICMGFVSYGQISMDYTMQTGNFNSTQTTNTNSSYFAGAFNTNSTEIGTYANGSGGGYVGDPGVALFRTFTTNVSGNAGVARALQVGDEFTITCYVGNSTSFFNNSSAGISFNGGTSNSSFSNYNSNQRAKFQINKNDGGLNGNWFGFTTSSAAGYATPGQDVTFKIKLTSAKTVNMTISSANGATTYDMPLAGTLGSSNNIQSFAIWNQSSGSNNNMFWKGGVLKSTGTVEIGNGNGTSTFDGAITDGLIPNSTTTVNANEVIKSGTGTITFAAANTYTGATRIYGGSLKLSGSGTLGSGSNVYISNGCSLDLNGVNTTIASVQETGSTNGGTISLGSATLTLSGGWSGTIYQNSISGTGSLVKQGTGTLALYGTQSYSGSTTVTGGEISSTVAMSSASYTINGGTFRIGAANIIPDAATVALQSGTFAVDNDETINNLTLTGGSLSVAAGKTLTINGTLTINSMGLISLGAGASVKFGTGGTLVYALSGSATAATEWPASNGPASVTVNSGTITLPASRTVTGNVTINGGTLDIAGYTLSRTAAGGTLSVANGATLKVGGTSTLPSNFTTYTFGTTSTVEYYGSSIVAQAGGQAYGNLIISGTGTRTLAGNVNGAAALSVTGGTLNLGTNTIGRATSGGTLTLSNGAALIIGGTNTFPANYATHSIGSTSTVEYAGSAQTVATLNSSQEYGNLVLSGSGIKSFTSGLVVGNNLTVGAGVTVNIAAAQTLTVKNILSNGGTFTIANNGNLIQQNNVSNSGAITAHRESSPLYRQDYTLWSSPVAGQQLQAFSPGTLSSRFYTYNSGTDLFAATSATGNFAAGQGYLIRMPNGSYLSDNTTLAGTINGTPAAYQQGTATMVFNGVFTGVPNNGDINVALGTGGNKYTLVGNPYPSPISLSALRAANSNSITGAVWFWRKKNNSANSAYCSVNSSGIYVDNGDATQTNPSGIVRTGQGFFVQLKSVYTSSTLQFTNAMRTADTANQFFRNGNSAAEAANDNHGIWLNLTNDAGLFSQMYAGYANNATIGIDEGLDVPYINDVPNVLSNLIEGGEYSIQTRPLPFNPADQIPVQVRVEGAGTYSIAADHTSGIFAQGQAAYLYDTEQGILHNLANGPYTFEAGAGTMASRFRLVFQDAALGIAAAEAIAGATVYTNASGITVYSGAQLITDVKIYDLRGRLLYSNAGVKANSVTVPMQAQGQVLLVDVATVGGHTVKKVVF